VQVAAVLGAGQRYIELAQSLRHRFVDGVVPVGLPGLGSQLQNRLKPLLRIMKTVGFT